MERATRTKSLQYSRARCLDIRFCATTGSPLADHGKMNVAGVPRARGRGLERLPTRDSPHQRADKLVEINGRFLIKKVHERKDSPAQTMSSQTKNRRHRTSRRTSWRPIPRPASAHRESRSTSGWCANWL